MRRKLITMGAVGLVLALLCAVEQVAVRRITDGAIQKAQEIIEYIRTEQLDTAKQKAHAMDTAWDRQAVILETMVDHSSTDDVRYALSRLIAALESGDRAAAMIYAGELEGGIEHVFERQAVTLENLL